MTTIAFDGKNGHHIFYYMNVWWQISHNFILHFFLQNFLDKKIYLYFHI